MTEPAATGWLQRAGDEWRGEALIGCVSFDVRGVLDTKDGRPALRFEFHFRELPPLAEFEKLPFLDFEP